ncbi:MAG TPA: ATP-binding protein [Rhodanobacteraceae bacterium]|nr:ATP-binding protein [Rhodanobacteraceae bacterium]
MLIVRWFGFPEVAEPHLRTILLMVAVVASVWLPFMVVRRATDATVDASTWVAHSAEVKATAYALLHTLRDMEVAVLSVYAALPAKEAKSRYRNDRTQIASLLGNLRELTRDNLDEQNRIGNLQAIIDGRVTQFDRALDAIDAGDRATALVAIADAQRLFAFRDTADAIVAAEQNLYRERGSIAAVERQNAEWISLGAMIAQLLLLGAVIYLSERQVRRRLEAESLFQRAVARAQRIVQTVREPIALLDRDLRILMANAAFGELYGVAGEIGVGQRLDAAGDGVWSDPALLQRLSDVATRDRELWDYELGQSGTDGVERIVLVNARQMALPERDDPAVLLTASDITARKRAEDQINDLNTQLEGKVELVSDINRELEAFSYSVSHDLRAPLRHIAGFGDKLAEHLGDAADERTRHYLDVIGASARRMSGLIEDLLVYSRLGRHALRLQPVDMQSLAEEARAILESEAEGRVIEWRIGRLPVIVADENMMRQVWQNLLGNAVKYTGEKVRAVIEIEGSRSQRGEYIFSVRDNGVGFDMQYAGKLFGVFQRLHKSTQFPGTGIGLANVRRILVRHGGRIWTEAVVDQGATFYFSIPASLDASRQSGVV